MNRAVLSLGDLGEVEVDRFNGREAIQALPAIEVSFRSDDPSLPLDDLVGAPAVLTFADDAGWARALRLLVREIAYDGDSPQGYHYTAWLSSPLALLEHRHGYRVFLDQTVQEIVSTIVADAGLPGDTLVWRLSEPLAARPQCVQYDESDWAFATRLLADEGVAVWHESDGDALKLVLGDHPSSHDATPGDAFSFDDGSGLAHKETAFFGFERTHRLCPAATHIRELDVQQPDVLIEGRVGEGYAEHFEYPGWVPDAGAAERRALVRLEQLRRESDVTRASTHSLRLVPGRTVSVADMPEAELDGDYLVTAVTHRMAVADETTTAGGDAAGGQHYVAECELVPHGERTFRPAPPMDRPRIDGIESVKVTGPTGEEIHVDELGRVKVAARWDPSGKTDDTTSAWARTVQLNMDASMILPRVGFEMAVAHRDGSPDMPVVLGKLYNGSDKLPYGLPATKATASLMSGTSPGGGSVNEIRLADDAGSQSFAVQASGDQGMTVGGDATITVTVNEKHNVKGNLTEAIDGSRSLSVGGTQTITAGLAHNTFAGARTVNVAGDEVHGVDLSRIVEAGTYTETVSGLYFTRCNTAMETCKATFSQAIGGAMALAAACGLNESVLGTRSELCAGARVVCAGMFQDKTYGSKTVTCGVNTLTASGTLAHNVTGPASIQAGATLVSSGSGIVIESAGAIAITAATLSVSAGTSYRMAGVHDASGDINLDNSTATAPVTKASS
ncbi:MAG: type VI secretion system tip protein TssI/VgrG [Polyangiaceae bacterium]